MATHQPFNYVFTACLQAGKKSSAATLSWHSRQGKLAGTVPVIIWFGLHLATICSLSLRDRFTATER